MGDPMNQAEILELVDRYGEEFIAVADPIFSHKAYQEMKNIFHHYGTVYEHCLEVAYLAHRMAKKFNLDTEACIRGALLHDFHLYQFAKREDRSLVMESFRHSRNHPKDALGNAVKYWEISCKEADIIVNHMFPFALPRCREAWIITFVDKYLAAQEYSLRFKGAIGFRMRRLRMFLATRI